jgi:hypothetical protein
MRTAIGDENFGDFYGGAIRMELGLTGKVADMGGGELRP